MRETESIAIINIMGIVDVCKMPMSMFANRLYYASKENKKNWTTKFQLSQVIAGCRRLSQVITGFRRLSQISKYHFRQNAIKTLTLQCIIFYCIRWYARNYKPT